MSTVEAMAARMYPSMASVTPTESAAPVVAPAQSDAPAQPAVTKPAVAEPPAKNEELSEPEKELAKAQRMYPPEKALEHVQPTWPVELPPEQQAQLTAAVHTELGRKLMMGPEEAKTVVNLVTSVGEAMPTAEQQAAWKSESETWLRAESQRTGLSTAQMLVNAKAYLARSEQGTKLFTERGLLNHPDLVKIAVERGRVARSKGLLK